MIVNEIKKSGSTRIISQEDFVNSLIPVRYILNNFRSVTGPGRSGAIAAAFISHIYGVPFIPYKQLPGENVWPLLIADTAVQTGRTLSKAISFYNRAGIPNLSYWSFNEPPRVKFWYEVFNE